MPGYNTVLVSCETAKQMYTSSENLISLTEMIKVRPIEKPSSVFHMIESRKRCNRFHSLYEIVCVRCSSDHTDVFYKMFSLLRLVSCAKWCPEKKRVGTSAVYCEGFLIM